MPELVPCKTGKPAKRDAPGEARTHNPGMSHRTVYKYRALTDCATGAMYSKECKFITYSNLIRIALHRAIFVLQVKRRQI
jgi:hypothetical protein